MFSWISHLLSLNHKQKTLNLPDLYELLPEYESNKLTQNLEDNWFDEIKYYPNKPSLLRTTIRTMGWKPLLNGLLLIPFVSQYKSFSLLNIIYIIIQMFFYIAQPLLLTFLMNFFESCSTMPIWQAWLLAIACILTAIGTSLFIQHVKKNNFYQKIS